MKKKEMLKEQKKLKEDRNRVYLDFNDSKEVKNVIFITIGVILFIGLAWLIAAFKNGDLDLLTKENDPIPEINNDLLICGTLYKPTDKEYYVLAYKPNNEDETYYQSIASKYDDSKMKLYTLDLESVLNQNCISNKTVIDSDLTKLKLSSETLLKIKNNKIVKAFTTKKSITEELD